MYRGDPNTTEPPQEDIDAYERIKANPLPELEEGHYQVITKTRRALYVDGSYADVYVKEIRGGLPELFTLETDLCDSAWFYPLIKTVRSHNVFREEVSHPKWHKMRKARGLPDVSIKMFPNKYEIVKLDLSKQ